ncbi:helix-turn-helix domain-containing protein [Vibrio parahaemolyticus]|uniref:helix-turn-helix domain-containing protein n=3 Tax=Vibrio parahaemolyticus TaxID=670 RepID=UPI0007A047E1|nr:helix-turn-helix domain-containing protein [Vibrio parahaemolyticus]KYY00755.1 hypothetical protein AWQ10_07300 [Vibrio parahaemolyticus]
MDLLRINDTCHVTGLSRKTIYRYMDKGTLKYQEINGKRYISLIDLEKIAHAKKNKSMSQKNDDTNAEITSLKNEIKMLKNSILELCEHINTTNKMLEKSVSKKSIKTQSGTQKSSLAKEKPSGNNERRAEEAKKRVFNALDKLLKDNSIPLYRGKISPSGVQRETGIDRGTISKYLQEWSEKNHAHFEKG